MSSGEWAYLIFVMLAVSIGALAALGAGAYIFLRVFAGLLNTRQKAWESAAIKIGAAIDRNTSVIYKPFIGERKGIKFLVTHYSVPRSKSSFDDYVQVEAGYPDPLSFAFQIKRPEYVFQRAAKLIERHLVNDSAQTFETEFDVECSDRSSLEKLLNADISDGDATSLMVSLLRAGNTFQRLIVCEKNVQVGVKAEFGDAETISKAVDSAIELAERIVRARIAANI